MMPPTSGHLTDDQFTECVIMAPSAASEAHLRDCAQCRQELVRFTTSMSDFGMAALAWSESQPQVSLRGVATPRHPHPLLVHARWAVVAALVLIIGVPVVLHGDHEAKVVPGTTAVATEVPDDSDAQIAQDNQLMRSVDVAIGMSEPSPFRQYGLQESPRPKLKRAPEVRSQ
jgi:predicted anti-sigma-YlaC factor YlaD